MKTAIVYKSQHGCTKKCVRKLQDKVDIEIDVYNLKMKPDISLELYDTILIGGSIHAGRIQGQVKKFCNSNLNVLLKKNIGLFLCCMEEGETAQKQFNDAYPEALRNHAEAEGLFGGEFNLEKMNFIEKGIVKKVAKVEQSISKINNEVRIEKRIFGNRCRFLVNYCLYADPTG